MKLCQSVLNYTVTKKAVKTGAWPLMVILVLSACDLLGTEVKSWELSGEVIHSVPAGELNDKQVKMAAFFFAGGDGRLTAARPMVSNFVVVDNVTPAFTLEIDTTHLSPEDGDRIILFMWVEADADANNAYDDTESRCIVINTSSDPVFTPDTYASFTYYTDREGLENGWYYDSPTGAREVTTLTGAELTHEVYF